MPLKQMVRGFGVVSLISVIGLAGIVVINLHPGTARPDFAPLAWLAPLALYDWRKRAVPHIAFVAIPCGLAIITAWLHGMWMLGAVALLVVGVSERRQLPGPFAALFLSLALPGAVGLIVVSPIAQLPGVLAILGFWAAYELGWWAGADALAAITLAVAWPDIQWLVSLAAAHGAMSLALPRGQIPGYPRRLSPAELDQVGVAGLPAIALAAGIYILWQWWQS